MNSWIVGVTGASGTIYARQLLRALGTYHHKSQFDVVFSKAALRVLREEEDVSLSETNPDISKWLGERFENITVMPNSDIGARCASCSSPSRGMVIIPCSMNTLAHLSAGISSNLITRAADVIQKEGKKLIVVPRETPLSQIHLENMLNLSRRGITVIPACPAFYSKPQSLEELINSFIMRVGDHMGFELPVSTRWKAPDESQYTKV